MLKRPVAIFCYSALCNFEENRCMKKISLGPLTTTTILVCSKILTTTSDFWKIFFSQTVEKEPKILTIDEHDFTNYLLVLFKKIKIDMHIMDSMLFLSDMWLTKIVHYRCCLFMINFADKNYKSQVLFILLSLANVYKIRKCVFVRLFSDCAKFPFEIIFRNKLHLTEKLYVGLLKAKYDYLRMHAHYILEPTEGPDYRDYCQNSLCNCIMCGNKVLWKQGNFLNCICCSIYYRRYGLEYYDE